jgi:hypothetical protein
VASWVSPLDVDGDGRDEILVGVHRRQKTERVASVRLLRWEGGRLIELAGERSFVVSAAAAGATGVTPADVDLAIVVTPQEGALFVGGFYLSRARGRVREVAPLTPVRLRVFTRRRVVVEEEPVPDPSLRAILPPDARP